MLDIEIYHGWGFLEGCRELKNQIDQIMQEIGLGKKASTNIICCTPESCDGRKKQVSFIRIYYVDSIELEKTIAAFKQHKLNMDIQTIQCEFISAKKMK